MGYESRLFIVDRKSINQKNKPPYVFGEKIAEFDLCKMGYDRIDGKTFTDNFKIDLDFDVYSDDYCPDCGNEINISIDRYGEKCKGAKVETVIGWLEKYEQQDHYRRIPPVLAFLKALQPDEWQELIVVHFGY
jgi:hypothetical protein